MTKIYKIINLSYLFVINSLRIWLFLAVVMHFVLDILMKGPTYAACFASELIKSYSLTWLLLMAAISSAWLRVYNNYPPMDKPVLHSSSVWRMIDATIMQKRRADSMSPCFTPLSMFTNLDIPVSVLIAAFESLYVLWSSLMYFLFMLFFFQLYP